VRRPLLLFAVLILTACGYHLAGHGRGVIPADVRVLEVSGTTKPGDELLFLWRRYVRSHAVGFTVASSGADAELRLDHVTESFSPVTFDAAGVATSYRMRLAAEISLWRRGKLVWSSGSIAVTGDVFAVGGPASITASRDRLRRDLNRKWIQEAWMRLASGF